MHDQQRSPPTRPAEHVESNASHEQPPRPQPSIYVASLADCNNGRLHGEWLDAARDPADIAAMLARSIEPDAEEFAIHDFEQFGSCRIHEYASIELVSQIARVVQEHGYAFAAWADVHEGDTERLSDFEAAHLGHHDSVEAYAEQMVEELGYRTEIAKLPESLQAYICVDTAAMARDITHSGDIYIAPDPDGGVWLFDANT